MHNKRNRLTTTLIVFTLTLAANYSSARFIIGEIGFGGLIVPLTGDGGTPTSLGDANALDFGPAAVIDTTGDFSSIPFGTPAFFTDFVIDPFVGPIDPLWVAGDFSFMLGTDMTIVSQDDNGLVLKGSGTAKSTLPNLNDTPGKWNFTSNPVGGGTFVFSSGSTAGSSVVNPVPEPSNIALLSLGLLGIVYLRYRKQ